MFLSFAVVSLLSLNVAGFNLAQEFSGSSFFNGWSFYGFQDNLTWGNVTWVDQADATSDMLAYINDAGNAILKVDNTTDILPGQLRNSVRITTQDSYDLGSLWIIDALHLPYGCSVWPAFWTMGPLWPQDGEIDIIEGINTMQANQMALHTLPGCTHPGDTNETGSLGDADCSIPSGCIVGESQSNSFGADFAAGGGGVWATQFDATGIFIWFWSRPDVPTSITSSTIDVSTWGPPSASYPSTTCSISEYFTAQYLVLDITLCGNWAGEASNYNCGTGPTGICYNDSVVGPGSPAFDDAYFEISYVRAYTSAAVTPTSTQVVVQTETVSATLGPGASSAAANPTSKVESSGAGSMGLEMVCGLFSLVAILATTLFCIPGW